MNFNQSIKHSFTSVIKMLVFFDVQLKIKSGNIIYPPVNDNRFSRYSKFHYVFQGSWAVERNFKRTFILKAWCPIFNDNA